VKIYVVCEAVGHMRRESVDFLYFKTIYVNFEVEEKRGKGGNKFCQNYIFADSGRTLFKRLYEGIFSKGNL